MALKIIRGAAGSGKSTYVLDEMKKHAQNGEKAILIVPEQFSHVAETELINKVGYLSAHIQATSFARLAKRMLAEAGRDGLAIDSAGKNMLMARVLAEYGKELIVFKGAWEKAGFLTALLDLISDFKRAQIDGSGLLDYAKKEKNPLLKQKLEELGGIYSRYEELINEKFRDSEDNVTKLAALIKEENGLKGTYIYLDSFFRFTANELDVVRSMLSSGLSVAVTVCAPKDAEKSGSIFEPCVQTERRLCDIAKECGTEIFPPVYLEEKYRFLNSPELEHLESQLYSYPNEKYGNKTENISLFMASDPYSETVRVAVEIRRAIGEKGLRYRDIAIIAGDLPGYQNLIKTVFPSFEIPVFTDNRRELLSHPVMVMLFSLFAMLTGGYRTQDVIAYCKTGYSGLNSDECDRLENYALMGHVERGDWLDDTRFLKRARMVFESEQDFSELDGEAAEEIIAIKNRLFAPVLTLKQKFSENRQVSARAEALFEFFEDICLRDMIEKQTAEFESCGMLQLADEYADVYNLLIETLDQMVLCLGEEKMGLSRLQAVLENGFSEYSMGVIPSAADQVFLGDVSRSLVKNVKLVFIMGAVDGAFPPAAPGEGILTDAERISLRMAGLELAPDTKKIAFDNQFLVYSAVNISSEAVFISCPVANLDGKGLRPSGLVSRVKKLFPQLSIESDLMDKEPDPEKALATRHSAYRYILGRMADGAEDELCDELSSVVAEDEKYRMMLRAAKENSLFKNEAQRLGAENVKGLYGSNLKGSISRFEKFSECPFSYFVQFGLKAKERKVLELDTPDIGWLLHSVIDGFSRTMQKNGESYHEVTQKRCEEIVDNLIAEMTQNMFIANLYSEKKLALLLKRLKQMVMKSVWVICEHIKRGEFEPCAFEVSFDENGEMPPITIDLPTGEKITLAGRIDRIDRYSDGTNLYIRIIDYKSGNKEFSLSDIFHRLSLQLAVYLTAVCDGGEKFLGDKPQPAGMFYFRLNDPVVSANGISDEAIQEEILKKYKMSGLVLSDTDIIKAMDNGISGYSKIIPVRLNKDGDIVSANSKSATMEQMNRLSGYMKRTLGEIGREILSGNVNISPSYDGKSSACKYCRYKSVCGFDGAHNRYRYLSPIADEEVWSKI